LNTDTWSTLSLKKSIINDKNFYCEVTDGEKIQYSFSNNVNPNKKIAKIFHQPLAYLLFQRKFFVLHGSAFSFNGKAIALCGLSSSGKSESIREISKNFKFITDDIIGVDFIDKKNICYPGLPFICSEKGEGKYSLNETRNRSLIWMKNHLDKDNIELEKIYFLEWGDKYIIENLEDEAAFKRLIPNSFRPLPFGADHESEINYLTGMSHILRNTDIYVFSRKRGDVKKSVNFLINHLNDTK
tara:strand:- start:72 stop:797 length:726 start_codon:yes stop_codon:yes gene_type:complete